MSDIKIGDVVKLKSGGPKMTVTKIKHVKLNDTALVTAIYFNGNQDHAIYDASNVCVPAVCLEICK